MKKLKSHENNFSTYTFPSLLRPIRRKAINDNDIPMLSMIVKHSFLMSAAFFVVYLIHAIIE